MSGICERGVHFSVSIFKNNAGLEGRMSEGVRSGQHLRSKTKGTAIGKGATS